MDPHRHLRVKIDLTASSPPNHWISLGLDFQHLIQMLQTYKSTHYKYEGLRPNNAIYKKMLFFFKLDRTEQILLFDIPGNLGVKQLVLVYS